MFVGMRPERLVDARGRRGAAALCPRVGAPLLAVQSLRGFDGVDDTAARFPPPAGSEVEERGEGREGEEGEGVAEDGGGQEGEEGARGVDCAPEGGHGRDARAARRLALTPAQREREVVLVRELVVIDAARPLSLPMRRKRKKKRRKRTTRRP